MEVAGIKNKKGYKLTELGLIPEDWEINTLGDVGDIKMCKRIFNYQTSKRGEVPFYKIGTFGKSPDAFISMMLYKEFRSKYSFPKKGSLLISASGTIGRTVVYHGEASYFQDSNIIWIDNDENLITNEYLHYILKVVKYNTEGSTIKRLYNSIIKSSKFLSPPTLTEQNAIATALSDVDALIDSIESLIKKKKAIKQGAMQRLLTPPHKGGQRLPGFEGEWEEVSLGDRSDISKLAGFEYSKYFNSYLDGGEIIVVRGTNITNNKFDFSDIKTIPRKTSQFLKRSQLNKGDLVFAYVGTIGPICLIEEDNRFHLGPNTARITVDDNLDIGFVLSVFKSWLIEKEIEFHTSTGAQPSLSMTKIRSFRIIMPKDIKEQKAIARVLSDMDVEIETLESKRDKYSHIKQGMMQELLTGKTRLV